MVPEAHLPGQTPTLFRFCAALDCLNASFRVAFKHTKSGRFSGPLGS